MRAHRHPQRAGFAGLHRRHDAKMPKAKRCRGALQTNVLRINLRTDQSTGWNRECKVMAQPHGHRHVPPAGFLEWRRSCLRLPRYVSLSRVIQDQPNFRRESAVVLPAVLHVMPAVQRPVCVLRKLWGWRSSHQPGVLCFPSTSAPSRVQCRSRPGSFVFQLCIVC